MEWCMNSPYAENPMIDDRINITDRYIGLPPFRLILYIMGFQSNSLPS